MVISDGKIDRIRPAEEILPTLLDTSSQEVLLLWSAEREAITVKQSGNRRCIKGD